MPQDLPQPQSVVLQLHEGGRDLLCRCPSASVPRSLSPVFYGGKASPLSSPPSWSRSSCTIVLHPCSPQHKGGKLQTTPNQLSFLIDLSVHLHSKCIKALPPSLWHRHSPTFGRRTKREAPGAAKCGISNDARRISNDAHTEPGIRQLQRVPAINKGKTLCASAKGFVL